MKITAHFKVLIYFFLFLLYNNIYAQQVLKFNGINLYPSYHQIDSTFINSIEKTNANWLSLITYIYGKTDSPYLGHDLQYQKWGESIEGLKYCIKAAHDKGMNVMLKPSLWYIDYGWPGELIFEDLNDQLEWQQNFESYIMEMVELSNQENVEMICFGTELNQQLRMSRPWTICFK